MKKIYLLVVVLAINFSTIAQQSPDWIRYASISPDGERIAFAFKGDIYTVPTGGGEAFAIISHSAHDFMPLWSNDSKKISFASSRYGNFDIYTVDAPGGEPVRLTFHSNNEFQYAFTHNNNSVIFGGLRIDDINNRQYPTRSQPEVYMVPVTGGRINQLWTIPAEDIKISRNGQFMIYHDKKGGENAFRKHHTSSVTRDIWIYNKETDNHKMITSFNGEDRNPVFSANESGIYYLSEESGSFNVHYKSLDNPASSRQVTSFDLHPVRFLSISDKGTLCYTHHGILYTQEQNGQPIKVNATVRTDNKNNNHLFIPVNGNVNEMAVAPNGKEVAYIVRGEVFVSSVEGSFSKRITNTPAQEKFVSFSPDGKSLIYASERDTVWSIFRTRIVSKTEPYFYASTLLNEEKLIKNSNDNYQPAFSPDGKEIAFIENKRSLNIFNIASGTIRTLLGPDKLFYMRDGDQYFRWSPDSKWLAVEYSPVIANTEVVLLAADGNGKMINLTKSGYGDFKPVWVNGGKQLLWFSDRDGMRSYANSGSRQNDVYSMFLNRESWDRFKLSKEEFALLKEMEEKAKKDKVKDDSKKKKEKKASKEPADTTLIKIDFDGLEERKARLTIHSSALSDAVLSKDGEKLYYLARFEKDVNLWSTVLRTKETKMEIALNVKSGSLQWDKEMKQLFLLADGKINKIDLKEKKKKSISIKSELELDIVAERQHMFDHVWKRVKTMFYISGYHGAPWDDLRSEYNRKLQFISNDFEFTELLSEMLGELNVSHSGARYRPVNPNSDNTASLGVFIDWNYSGEGIKITGILEGGPLDKDIIKITGGMIIEEIDGKKIGADIDFAMLLNRREGKLTSLKIYNPVMKSSELITVKPISIVAENSLLYKRWVKINEEEVKRLGNGELGYVHIPSMSDGPYRNTYEKVMGKYHDKKGLIIDTRFNGGGDLVSDLAMFFTGEKFLNYSIESRSVGYEPAFRWTKPTVAMVNEANYSDGHCFACGYKDLGIGTMIGMPVPGTCSWAGWERLQNGTITYGAVPVSSRNAKGIWQENQEAVPDVVIKNEPGYIDKGKDQQLEKAVEELLKTIMR